MIYSLACFVVIFSSAIWCRGAEAGMGVSLLQALACVLILGVCKLYCIEWRKVMTLKGKSSSLGLVLYENLLFPVVLIALMAPAPPLAISAGQRACLLVVFILSADPFGWFRRALESIYPGPNDLEARKLFLRYPAVNRLDLIPMDLLINFPLAFYLYRHYQG